MSGYLRALARQAAESVPPPPSPSPARRAEVGAVEEIHGVRSVAPGLDEARPAETPSGQEPVSHAAAEPGRGAPPEGGRRVTAETPAVEVEGLRASPTAERRPAAERSDRSEPLRGLPLRGASPTERASDSLRSPAGRRDPASEHVSDDHATARRARAPSAPVEGRTERRPAGKAWHETYQRVLDWVGRRADAEPAEHAAGDRAPAPESTRAPRSPERPPPPQPDVPVAGHPERAGAASAPPAPAAPGPRLVIEEQGVALSIGSIHVTVEEPAAQRAPRPAPPKAVVPPADGGSRLVRHYLSSDW